MSKFGSVTGLVGSENNPKFESKLLGIRHNVEGIILASTKPEEEARKELNNPNSDSLEELVKEGKAIIRLQDFWYGNGILGGVFNKLQEEIPELKNEKVDLMDKILYPESSKIVSGYQNIPENKFYKYFKQAVDVATRVYFPVYQGAYLLNQDEYKQTNWFKRGISQDDLKAVLTSDMNQVQNKIFELMKQRKIEYAIIGTWDLQTSQNSAETQSFFNVINTVDGEEYRQALGAWSFLVNQRNTNSSPGRRQAISQIIKIALSPEPNFEYFKADSKVQFTVKSQNDIKNKVKENTESTSKHYKEFYTSLGYKSHDELMKVFAPILELANSANKTPFYQWETVTEDEPLNDSNVIKGEFFTGEKGAIRTFVEFKPESLATLTANLKDEIALRNALAAMFSKKMSQFSFQGKSWLIKDGIIKPEEFDKKADLKDGDGWHLRKIEKVIFGANGDNNDEKMAVVNKVISALANNSLETLYKEVEDNALKFIKEVAITPASDDVIKKAARLHFNEFVNQAVWQNFVGEQVKEKEKTLPNGATVAQIQTEVNNFLKTLSFDKILDVLTSHKSIKDGGVGEIKFQPNRIDHSNPILTASLWGNWNDQTFGNVQFLQNIAKENTNKDLQWFQNKIMGKLTERYDETTSTINKQPGSSTFIKFDKK
ncbi:hypothetical protein NPA11_03220 [Mycoplasma sp. 1578d]|nr:hypothetical protein [Mycoplasma sp. 1578d]UUM19754.1 hypothetical protein NPA11_03220 [Mycoplasma sp. 1578d]